MPDISVARPGDLCILLAPRDDERLILRKEQDILVNFYGGWLVPEPHITCQRFRMPPGQPLGAVLDRLQVCTQKIPPFTINAAGLTQMLAPFWGTYVLRWQVQEDDCWRQFISLTDAALSEAGCELHYQHDIPVTCSAVDLTYKVNLDEKPRLVFPHPLFTARKVLVTGVLGSNEFETLGEVQLEGI